MTETLSWTPPARRVQQDRASSGQTGGVDAVLVTPKSQVLQDEIARIAVAAGIALATAETIAAALALSPGIVLVDTHALERAGRALRAFGGAETICVGFDADEPWQQSARHGVDGVAVLPQAAAWLAEHLARRNSPAGRILGVAGAFGGAGGSTLACLLAREAAESGLQVLLAETGTSGGGLEYRVGAAEASGLRWQDLAGVEGTVNPVQLAAALPEAGRFAVLGNVSGEPAPEGLEDEVQPVVLHAARAAFALTILDLGTCPTRHSRALEQCDALLAVVGGGTARLLAAKSWWTSLGSGAPPTFAVVRGPLPEGMDEARIAALLGMDLAGYLPWMRGLASASDDGRLLEAGRRRMRRAVRRVLAASGPAAGGEP
ncbi:MULTISPECIES: septum site-determining protein Ssd [Arthrobacter]|uniref:septum site-determining protein Ssd n=1 Tax=Arthrobacter TaxID=1663 RepID=UPI001264849F|nr:septum site-determining protein Ssd [Arthrobacter citreus]